jgi:general secretion pathway protein D
MHIDLDVSQVLDRIDLGGVSEPEIGQNKATADVRLKDGEVNLIGGIIQQTDSKSLNGIPGLASIPVIGRLFSGDTTEKDRTELVIAIIPHILRGQEVTSSNLRGVAAGNATQIKVGYLPRTLAPAATAPGTAVPADQRNASAPAAPPATAPPVGTSALPPAAAPPATAPAMAPPATASPAPTPPGPIPPRIGPNGLPPGVILPGGPQPGAGPPGATSPGGASPGVTPGSAALGAARVSFLPANGLETQLSQSVTVTIYAENVKDLVQSVASLGFDPKILRVTNIVAGDLPQRNGKQVQPAKNILNDSGVAEATLTRGAGDPGVSGSGGLFQIVLQAVGRGNTMLTLKNVSMSAPGGRPIPSNVPPPLAVSVK